MRIWLGTILLILLCEVTYPAVKKDTISDKSAIHKIDALIKQARRLTLKNPDAARDIAEQSLVLSKKVNYKRGIGQSFNAIGVTYWVQSCLSVSQFYLVLAVPYLKGDSTALSDCYRNIARNYVDLKDYKLGLHYFKSSIKLAGKNVNLKAEIFTELTSLFNATNDYENGLMHIKFAFKYSRMANNPGLIGILYNRLGQIYISTNKLDSAQRALDTCYQISLKIKNKRLRTVLLIDQSKLSVLKKDLVQASAYATNGYLLADTIGSSELKLRALNVLTDIYQKQGNLKQALLSQSKAIKLHERISNFHDSKTLQLIQDYADLNTKLNRIEQINNNNSANEVLIKTQNRTIILLVISLITAVTFLIVIYIYYKEKNKMNNKLQAQHQVLLDQKKLIEIQRTNLEEVNKLKDKLLAIIGHDLRTPIASLISIADLFAMDYITPEEVTKLMHDLTPVIKGAELTLTNLTDFADSQMQGQNIRASNVDVCLIADEMKETFAHQLQQKNISLTNNCLSQGNVWADSNHIKVIMRNLISNAIKFTNNDGRITVTSVVKDNQMQICVEDSGVGMTPEQTERLFDHKLHFSQIGTSGEKGTGLGLLLCKELIELNKGTLWVDTAAGAGCRFFFTLPLFSPAD
jgi:signal transduction histidine kinase